jgi:uroporphyrinogen decarboxylase
MNSRERMTALLSSQPADRMGLFEHFWPETLNQVWPRQGYPEGAEPSDYFNYDMSFTAGGLNSEPFPGRMEILEEDEERKLVRDGRGATLRYWKNKSGTPEHVAFEVTTPEIWKKYREPLLETNRERIPAPEEVRKNMEKTRGQGKFACWNNLFVFELLRATLGDQVFLPSLLMDPDWIKDFCQVYLDFYLRHYEILVSEAGPPDGLMLYEDWGYKQGLFCSPKVLRDLILPYEKALVDFFKSHGVPVIIHSCGDIRKAIPLFIEAGFSCLQAMEAKAGCDVVEIAHTYGNKLSYMGNINIMALETNDMDRVRAEIVPKLQELKAIRAPYVFHSDHSISPQVALKTYEGALEIFRENANY